MSEILSWCLHFLFRTGAERQTESSRSPHADPTTRGQGGGGGLSTASPFTGNLNTRKTGIGGSSALGLGTQTYVCANGPYVRVFTQAEFPGSHGFP